MSAQKTTPYQPLADDAQTRTIAPDASHHHDDDPHGHDHGDNGHGYDHSFGWPEALRIGMAALASILVWFRV